MRVGILTFHSSYNFGANLQTLATQEMLKRRDCSPVVIDYRDPWRTEMYRTRVSPQQREAHEAFIRRHIHLSPLFRSEKEVQEYCEDSLDVILVGSDQVFRLLPRWAPKQLMRRLRTGSASSEWTEVSDRLPVYWLPWPKTARRTPARAAIAASACGTAFYYLGRSLQRQACRSLLDFDFVSVRDDWTRSMVTWLSRGKVKPEMCPDPVFGLSEHFQPPPGEAPSVDVSKTILVSADFDAKWLEEFRRLAHDRGFTISNLPDPHMTYAFDQSDFAIGLPLSPLAWYGLLAKAAGYIGTRYHGLVSSMANGTPAVSLDVSNRPRVIKTTSRPYDLLCRKAGAAARYVPVNWLARPTPAVILERLMDGPSLDAANRYAESARTRLAQVFDRILAGAEAAVRV
ncbi:MAG: polysaccharide pyruvyl transferase family protein [Planctomycetes bacterium]|nr:polysaccharide pyruvyl transferase family protein [Planctomycetota bacterium]